MLSEESTRDLIEQLAQLEDQVRRTPACIRDEDGAVRLNPAMTQLALRELEIRRQLRLRRAAHPRTLV
jgi:hypothetical protein